MTPCVSNSPCPKIHCGYDQMLCQHVQLTVFSCNNLKLSHTCSPLVTWEVKEFLIQVCQENTFVQVAVDRKQSLNSILIPGSHMHNSKKVDQTIGCCCV